MRFVIVLEIYFQNPVLRTPMRCIYLSKHMETYRHKTYLKQSFQRKSNTKVQIFSFIRNILNDFLWGKYKKKEAVLHFISIGTPKFFQFTAQHSLFMLYSVIGSNVQLFQLWSTTFPIVKHCVVTIQYLECALFYTVLAQKKLLISNTSILLISFYSSLCRFACRLLRRPFCGQSEALWLISLVS